MDWQLILTWLVVGTAGAHIFWRACRVWRGTKPDCGGCECGSKTGSSDRSSSPRLIPVDELKLRPRTE